MKRFVALFVIFVVLSVSISAEEFPTITVFDFEYSEALTKSEMTSIISLLSSELFKTGKFTVLDIQQRDSLMSEMQFSLTGISDEESLLEIGRMLSAESIVTGKIGTVGSRLVLNAKMLETETARIQSTADGVYDNIDIMLDNIPGIARILAGEDGSVMQTGASSENLGTSSTEDLTSTEGSTGQGSQPVASNNKKTLGFVTLGAAVALAGTGGYLVFDSLNKIQAANDAKDAYNNATSNFDSLYSAYTSAYSTAENSETMLYLGAGLIGGGVASGVLSALFFSQAKDASGDSMAMMILPMEDSVSLSLGFSY